MRKASYMSYKTKVKCQTKNLRKIRTFVENTLRELQIPEKDRHLLIVAVDEVCANRIIHSNHCDHTHEIQVTIRREVDEVIFEITDQGETFNVAEYKEPTLEHIIKEKKTGGLGLILVKRIIDHIQFETVGKKQICRLSKMLSV